MSRTFGHNNRQYICDLWDRDSRAHGMWMRKGTKENRKILNRKIRAKYNRLDRGWLNSTDNVWEEEKTLLEHKMYNDWYDQNLESDSWFDWLEPWDYPEGDYWLREQTKSYGIRYESKCLKHYNYC